MTFLYNLLLILGAPIWVPWMLRRSSRRAEQVNWRERFGYLPIIEGEGTRVWIHAVSVGEVIACLPILRELRKSQATIILSVTTSSGHETARKQAEGLFDHLVYLPLDLPWMTRRAMRRVRPDVLAIMETELWMNLIRSAKAVGARTLLLNGRISDRSFPRSLKVRFFYRSLLGSIDRCLMQSDTDVERIRELGAPRAAMLGNVKFDQAAEGTEIPSSDWATALGLTHEKSIVVVGSARAEEFSDLISALRPMLTDVQVVIAPRHVDRVEELLVACTGLPISRRSLGETWPPSGVLILDSYGELASVYSVADVVIIGGGFANLGGQNIIQPLALGKPVIFGPHMQNFRDVATLAVRSGASIQVEVSELGDTLATLLADEPRQVTMGAAATALVRANLGAAERYASAILGPDDAVRPLPIQA